MDDLITDTITIALKPEMFNGKENADIEAECIGCLAVHPAYNSKLGVFTVTHIPTGLTLVHHPDKWQCLGFMMDVLTSCSDIEQATADAIKNRDPAFNCLAIKVHTFNDELWKLAKWRCEHDRALSDYCEPCGRINSGG